MEFRGIIYSTLKDWSIAEDLANRTLVGFDDYTSKTYANTPTKTIDGRFILEELKGFESQLKEVGFEFVDLYKSRIKIGEII